MPTKRKPTAFHSAAYRRFCRKLRDARAGVKLTQRQVAERIGKHYTFVAKIETGERRVDVIELQQLARVYKKPVIFFLD